jgi:hypothetical protein
VFQVIVADVVVILLTVFPENCGGVVSAVVVKLASADRDVFPLASFDWTT